MELSPNQRIAVNIFVTYGRSLLILLCGLITGRWCLIALGETDYGLLFLVGGMMFFLTSFNAVSAGAVSRFYAYSTGESQRDRDTGLENCRKWFNTALLIHTIFPVILILTGFFAGDYAVRHWLTIPVERIEACSQVWFWSCITGFISMVTVPFTAFYYAKQYAVEPVIYSSICTVLNVFYMYYIVSHRGDWLVPTAISLCIFQTIPELILSIRAKLSFKECKIVIHYLWSWQRTKELLKYCAWSMFGCFALISKKQCLSILINKYFGVSVNSAMSIANHVSSKATIFSNGLTGAFSPAIVNACGAGDHTRMHHLAFMVCRLGTMLTLMLILPLSMELEKLLELWLKVPPEYTAGLCYCVFIMIVLDQLSAGHMIAVSANGRIGLYQSVLGSVLILTFPLAWLFAACGGGVYSVGLALVVTMAVCSAGRVIIAGYLVGMSWKYWLRHVVFPTFLLCAVSCGIGGVPLLLMQPSILRVFLSGCLVEAAFFCISWFYVLEPEERAYISEKIFQKIRDKRNCGP